MKQEELVNMIKECVMRSLNETHMGILYHFTDLTGLWDIIASDGFMLSYSNNPSRQGKYYMSLTRHKSNMEGFAATNGTGRYSTGNVRLTINADLLSNVRGVKIVPFEYYNTPKEKWNNWEDPMYGHHGDDEWSYNHHHHNPHSSMNEENAKGTYGNLRGVLNRLSSQVGRKVHDGYDARDAAIDKISKKYGVPFNDITNGNPYHKEWGIKKYGKEKWEYLNKLYDEACSLYSKEDTDYLDDYDETEFYNQAEECLTSDVIKEIPNFSRYVEAVDILIPMSELGSRYAGNMNTILYSLNKLIEGTNWANVPYVIYLNDKDFQMGRNGHSLTDIENIIGQSDNRDYFKGNRQSILQDKGMQNDFQDHAEDDENERWAYRFDDYDDIDSQAMEEAVNKAFKRILK